MLIYFWWQYEVFFSIRFCKGINQIPQIPHLFFLSHLQSFVHAWNRAQTLRFSTSILIVHLRDTHCALLTMNSKFWTMHFSSTSRALKCWKRTRNVLCSQPKQINWSKKSSIPNCKSCTAHEKVAPYSKGAEYPFLHSLKGYSGFYAKQ